MYLLHTVYQIYITISRIFYMFMVANGGAWGRLTTPVTLYHVHATLRLAQAQRTIFRQMLDVRYVFAALLGAGHTTFGPPIMAINPPYFMQAVLAYFLHALLTYCLQAVLARMETAGLCVDTSSLASLVHDMEEALAQVCGNQSQGNHCLPSL